MNDPVQTETNGAPPPAAVDTSTTAAVTEPAAPETAAAASDAPAAEPGPTQTAISDVEAASASTIHTDPQPVEAGSGMLTMAGMHEQSGAPPTPAEELATVFNEFKGELSKLRLGASYELSAAKTQLCDALGWLRTHLQKVQPQPPAPAEKPASAVPAGE